MGYSKKRFEELHAELVVHERELLSLKRGEYTEADEDCISNFRQLADFEGRSPEEVCLTLTIKHIQSIQRAISTGAYSFSWWNEKTGSEGLKQRIADARNYLALLAAVLDDKEMKKAVLDDKEMKKEEKRWE